VKRKDIIPLLLKQNGNVSCPENKNTVLLLNLELDES
jgi:hypothetical protein